MIGWSWVQLIIAWIYFDLVLLITATQGLAFISMPKMSLEHSSSACSVVACQFNFLPHAMMPLLIRECIVGLFDISLAMMLVLIPVIVRIIWCFIFLAKTLLLIPVRLIMTLFEVYVKCHLQVAYIWLVLLFYREEDF